MIKKNLTERISKYRFEFRHITVLLVILVSFQIILSFIQKSSLQSFLEKTQEWYQQDSAERMANLSTTSLELFVGNMKNDKEHSEVEKNKIIQSFNIILSQQLLEPNVEETCLIMLSDNKPYIINDGRDFYNFLQNNQISSYESGEFLPILNLFFENLEDIKQNEEIFSFSDDLEVIHILVPFIPFGEFIGAFYMKNQSNLDFITKEILKSYDEVAIIYTSLNVKPFPISRGFLSKPFFKSEKRYCLLAAIYAAVNKVPLPYAKSQIFDNSGSPYWTTSELLRGI